MDFDVTNMDPDFVNRIAYLRGRHVGVESALKLLTSINDNTGVDHTEAVETLTVALHLCEKSLFDYVEKQYPELGTVLYKVSPTQEGRAVRIYTA